MFGLNGLKAVIGLTAVELLHGAPDASPSDDFCLPLG